MAKKTVFFPYPGSKHKMFDWISTFFPQHDIFCDVFGGSGIIIINKPPVKINVYNDFDESIANLFRVFEIKKNSKN